MLQAGSEAISTDFAGRQNADVVNGSALARKVSYLNLFDKPSGCYQWPSKLAWYRSAGRSLLAPRLAASIEFIPSTAAGSSEHGKLCLSTETSRQLHYRQPQVMHR